MTIGVRYLRIRTLRQLALWLSVAESMLREIVDNLWAIREVEDTSRALTRQLSDGDDLLAQRAETGRGLDSLAAKDADDDLLRQIRNRVASLRKALILRTHLHPLERVRRQVAQFTGAKPSPAEPGHRSLGEGERVAFLIEQDKKGPAAVYVR